MKNDIDALLNALFPNGRGQSEELPKSKAARDAEAFLKSFEDAKKTTDDVVQRQLDLMGKMNSDSDLNRLQMEAENSVAEMRRLLAADGVDPQAAQTTVGVAEPAADVAEAFKKARETAGNKVIGQDAFLDALFTAFKRPSVTGTAEGKPAAVIVISGREGTGRHSALSVTAASLKEGGVLKNGNLARVDLSLYSGADSTKLMIQDLYSAIQSGSDVLLFENFEKCHKSLLPMLTNLCESGVLQLSTRYALQKGMLIDVGTALVPNAVSEIKLNGQYVVFLTQRGKSAFIDAFGAPFWNTVTDFCVTEDFSAESLTRIGQAAMEELAARAKERLGFTLTYGNDAAAFFAARFSEKDGVESIDRLTEDCFKRLSEEKLNRGAGELTGEVKVEENALTFVFPEFTVSAGENRPAVDEQAVEGVRKEMERIVGLSEVKDYVLALEQNYIIQRLREERGLKADVPAMHMIFTGNAGTGKTTIARLVSKYLKAMGVLSGGQLIEVTRADLVGKYVGHTAPLTQQVIRSALGGVLFIDEAYSLYRGQDDSFGLEAIDTIVKGMEDNRRDLIVILAGYSREMMHFLEANSGLKSRFPNIIEFPDYSADELLQITRVTAEDKGYKLSEECDEPLKAYYAKRQAEDARTAGNGRMARNLVEDAILKQSRRLTAEKVDDLTTEQLETLLVEDFDFAE